MSVSLNNHTDSPQGLSTYYPCYCQLGFEMSSLSLSVQSGPQIHQAFLHLKGDCQLYPSLPFRQVRLVTMILLINMSEDLTITRSKLFLSSQTIQFSLKKSKNKLMQKLFFINKRVIAQKNLSLLNLPNIPSLCSDSNNKILAFQ